ncbi:MAG: hypothetical protein HC831_07385 [Chloroflexia bacterium]|nr:hypothetical protein [Chloroflexia bacterium]
MKSGRPLWDELCMRYQSGVDSVRSMQAVWDLVKPFVDEERFNKVSRLLLVQEMEANGGANHVYSIFKHIQKKISPILLMNLNMI